MFPANAMRAPQSSQSNGSPLMYSVQSPGVNYTGQMPNDARPAQYSPLPGVMNRAASGGRPQPSGSSPMMTYQQGPAQSQQNVFKARSLNEFSSMTPQQQHMMVQQQMAMQAQQNLFNGAQPQMSEVRFKIWRITRLIFPQEYRSVSGSGCAHGA
jgi:hypothetical protein